MYHDLLGRDVLNVSIDTSFWHDAPLLIVESYYPAGVGETFTKAAFYRMDPVQTQKVLEFENAGKLGRILENDQMDIQSISASYTMPLDQIDVYDELIPKISVYGKQTNIRKQGEEVISKMEETLESTYIWNNDKLIFEES